MGGDRMAAQESTRRSSSRPSARSGGSFFGRGVRRRGLALATGSLAATVGLVLAAGPAAAAPSVSASPSSGLSNGDHVSLTISGYPANDSLVALQCNPDPSI